MPLARALVLCPSAAVVALQQEEVEASERAFTALLADLCPAVENIDPGHVHADVRGMAKLAGLAPSAYLAELQESLAGRTGLPVRAGGGTTVFGAHAAAAYLASPTRLLRASDAAELLGGLPVDVLPVSEAMLRRLHLFGLERLEQVGALPPAALQAQFGREGLLAWRLIHGEETERITPALDDVRVVERIELPTAAVASPPLVLATEILLQRATRRQEIGGRSLRRADWTAELENGERMPLRFVFREPTADKARMLLVIRNGVERLALAAPAVVVELTLSGICSEYTRQERLWQTGPRGAAALGAAIEQLALREGGPQIYRIVEVEPWSRIPERQRALAAYSP
jgi:DNA polymerase-4/protein ImuB